MQRGLAAEVDAWAGYPLSPLTLCHAFDRGGVGRIEVVHQFHADVDFGCRLSPVRKTLVVGATAFLRQVRVGRGRNASPWLIELLKRKPPKLVAVALANKIARIAWKMMMAREVYKNNAARPVAACAA